MTDSGQSVSARECIVCGTPTTDRSPPYNHPRCDDWLPCALRRNEGKARPKPVATIIAEARAKGLAVPPELEYHERAHAARSGS